MPGKDAAAWVRVPAAADAFFDDRAAAYTAPASNSQALRSDPRFRRLTTELHRRGPRPCGEVLVAALARLQLHDRNEVLDLAEHIWAFEPEVVAYLGADRWPPAPIWRAA